MKKYLTNLIVFCMFISMMHFEVSAKNKDMTEEYIKVPQGKIYIRTEGQGHPIVIINGGPGGGHTVFVGWFDFLKKQGYQLVFFDDIGRGRSTRKIEGKFTPQMTVNDIESVRQYLGVKKVTLMAHSYGGIPAMQYALQHSQHVKKLVMLNASYDTKSQQMNANQYFHIIRTRYPEKWRQLESLKAQGIKSTDDKFAEIAYGRYMDWYQWFDIENRSKNRKYQTNDERDYFNLQVFDDIIDLDYGEIRGTLLGINIEDQMKGFAIPTLITAGRYDNASTPELVHRLYDMLPKGTATYTMFEQSGHWPWVEETEKFEQVLSRFLNN